MKTAIYPGSFDPVTLGHINIIERAAKLFDKVIVLIATNPKKSSSFSVDERIELLRRCIKIDHVEVDSWPGLLVDYLKKRNANVFIKGVRNVPDFEYEQEMALLNKKMCPVAETVLMVADESYMFHSSSNVRQIAAIQGDISSYISSLVPAPILNEVIERFK